MSITNIKNSQCRIEKELDISTSTGRYQLNVPGPGNNPNIELDPHIRLQKWGGNLQTNTIQLESELFGITKTMNRDCIHQNNYRENKVHSVPISTGTNNSFVDQTRASMPAWTLRDVEQSHWNILHENPQEKVEIPFEYNQSTRIFVKDQYNNY